MFENVAPTRVHIKGVKAVESMLALTGVLCALKAYTFISRIKQTKITWLEVSAFLVCNRKTA